MFKSNSAVFKGISMQDSVKNKKKITSCYKWLKYLVFCALCRKHTLDRRASLRGSNLAICVFWLWCIVHLWTLKVSIHFMANQLWHTWRKNHHKTANNTRITHKLHQNSKPISKGGCKRKAERYLRRKAW